MAELKPNEKGPLYVADPYYPAAVENARKAFEELVRKGIMDINGRRIRQDLPPDMQPGSDRDFGG